LTFDERFVLHHVGGGTRSVNYLCMSWVAVCAEREREREKERERQGGREREEGGWGCVSGRSRISYDFFSNF